MRRTISTLLLGTCLLAGQTAQSLSSLPEWLIPYPGASAVTKIFPQLVESSYTAMAKPEEVSRHYEKLFAAKGLVSHPNADGLGTVIRASAPECDLLIKVRESPSGSSVKVDCSSPQSPSPGA